MKEKVDKINTHMGICNLFIHYHR